jgi:hypothetical protein
MKWMVQINADRISDHPLPPFHPQSMALQAGKLNDPGNKGWYHAFIWI